MKKLLLIAFSVFMTLFTGCRRTDLIGPNVTSTAPLSNSYQPTTPGSIWKYASTVTGKADEQITVKATGALSFINYQPYYALSSSSSVNGISTSYYFTNGPMYSFRTTTIVADALVELQYLNSSLLVGDSWTTKINDTGFVNSIPGQFEGTIIEKNITKTIGSNSFTNVIHTTINMQYNYGQGDGFTTVATYDYYLAKGIGLIEVDQTVSGVVVGKETITSYDVK